MSKRPHRLAPLVNLAERLRKENDIMRTALKEIAGLRAALKLIAGRCGCAMATPCVHQTAREALHQCGEGTGDE